MAISQELKQVQHCLPTILQATNIDPASDIQRLIENLNPEMHFNYDKGLNQFEEHVVSTFFNRVDALLTAILQISEKNAFFKPG